MSSLAEALAERLAEKETTEQVVNTPEKGREVPISTKPDPEKEEEKEETGEHEPGSEPDRPEDEGVAVEMLTDLAAHLGVEPEFLYGLKMKLSDTGEPITIGEVKDRLQEAERSKADVQKVRDDLEKERLAFVNSHREMVTRVNTLNEQGQAAQNEMAAAEADYQRIDWRALENIDPGRAALEKQNLLQRYAVAKNKVERAQQEAMAMAQHQIGEAKRYHDGELMKAIPEWKDRKKAKEDVDQIIEWAREKYKFTDPELINAVDWRSRDVLRKAWLYDKITAEKKKLTSVPPKIIGKGVTLPKSDAAKDKLKGIIEKAKKSRDVGDKVAAGRAILEAAMSQSSSRGKR